MADRVSASITIGGSLSRSSYAELVEHIREEGLATEWDGEPFDAHHRVVGAPLNLYAHEVAGGCFDDLESWCAQNRLPFARWSGGYAGQWGPERVVFRGEGTSTSYTATEDDEIVVAREKIEQLGSLEAVLAHFDAADFAVPPLAVEGDESATAGTAIPRAEGSAHVE
ncbi:hypothetical protein E5A73_19545 [Sphingomonas gei]|uniref:Uncharacterized protein n=1 Tax=Sphingomonas gei TaxID=1395960 RepID=A0A4S1WZK1_9SPHN|nr:hypothetical protein [Sphingomonas gei]TGX49044.1 hypothetical protein E5A73_19545 [Sphingomonas gei]